MYTVFDNRLSIEVFKGPLQKFTNSKQRKLLSKGEGVFEAMSYFLSGFGGVNFSQNKFGSNQETYNSMVI